MSSAFDTEVYAERQRLPGSTVSIEKLMKAALWNEESAAVRERSVSLTLEYRSDVETSMWWTVRWGDGCSAASQELELALYRAAVMMRRDDERAQRYAEGR